MGGLGPAPKESKRRRNADTYSDVKAVVVDDGERVGPELPGEWSEFVRAWYDTWRQSPQAKVFVNTDWFRLRMLAPLIARMELNPHHMVMAEIRQSESLLGATYSDRLRSRMKIESVEETVEKPKLTVLDEYKKRLTG